jgi:hypothetical protein
MSVVYGRVIRSALLASLLLALAVPALASDGHTLHGKTHYKQLDVTLHLDSHLRMTGGELAVALSPCPAGVHTHRFRSESPILSGVEEYVDEHGTLHKGYRVRESTHGYLTLLMQVERTAHGAITVRANYGWEGGLRVPRQHHLVKCSGGETFTLHSPAP